MAKRTAQLSPRREAWAQARGPQQFTGSPLAPPDATEARFRAALERMTEDMHRVVAYRLDRLFRSPLARERGLAMDASFESAATRLLSELHDRFMALWVDRAGGLINAWLSGISRQSAVGLGKSLKEASGGVTLKTDVISGAVADVMRASVTQNVALIKSIPDQYFSQIEGAVMRSIQSGRGMADLQPAIEKLGLVSKKRAALIARDQTSKATTAINTARMKGLGVKKFKWVHSGGGKEPRPLHKNVLNGNVYLLDDPPVIDERTGERGLPGQLVNCRCRMVPVIEFGDEDE